MEEYKQMGAEEMAISYKSAKNKIAQIGILADLNCISKKEVREILRGQGFEIYEPQGRKKEHEEAVEKPVEVEKPAEEAKNVPEIVLVAAYEKMTELKLVIEKYEKTVNDAKEGIKELEAFLEGHKVEQ